MTPGLSEMRAAGVMSYLRGGPKRVLSESPPTTPQGGASHGREAQALLD